ncbi:MAG: imidazole glycerol phosphate synthase subunit HisH [Candidatus Methanomethylophilaceae archaeon]|jgi:glutamine amidotransferase|nr:imidazole glycerol phosphate synthase subunit HisH [Candidatus Methanomethylophilaceae archaeon]NLF33956.1 imidazole glycerol phosphate synthase subunit HisH [Thermoplasmatales archaeon]
MPLEVTVADYGVGNLHSIRKALEICGAHVSVVSDMERLLDAECLVFPGVGAFDSAMRRIQPWKEEIRGMLDSGTPALGICIGAQIMFDSSEEGDGPGMGFMPGRVVRLAARQIPHMGWDLVETGDPAMEGIRDRHFYYAHSYHGSPDDPSTAVGSTEYEGVRIPVLFRKSSFYGSQFHPEKSSSSGLAFLRNFISFAEGCL